MPTACLGAHREKCAEHPESPAWMEAGNLKKAILKGTHLTNDSYVSQRYETRLVIL